MLRKWLLLALALHAAPCAADSAITLWCARGVPDYPDAEITLSSQGNHVLNVVFVGFRPSRVRADWSLRDCLNTANKLDGSRDIVGRLWYRDRWANFPRELLQVMVRKAQAAP